MEKSKQQGNNHEEMKAENTHKSKKPNTEADKLMKQLFMVCVDFFKIYDDDQSGYLDRGEQKHQFGDLSEREGFEKVTDERLEEIINQVDLNGDGDIDLDEFLEICLPMIESKVYYLKSNDAIEERKDKLEQQKKMKRMKKRVVKKEKSFYASINDLDDRENKTQVIYNLREKLERQETDRCMIVEYKAKMQEIMTGMAMEIFSPTKKNKNVESIQGPEVIEEENSVDNDFEKNYDTNSEINALVKIQNYKEKKQLEIDSLVNQRSSLDLVVAENPQKAEDKGQENVAIELKKSSVGSFQNFYSSKFNEKLNDNFKKNLRILNRNKTSNNLQQKNDDMNVKPVQNQNTINKSNSMLSLNTISNNKKSFFKQKKVVNQEELLQSCKDYESNMIDKSLIDNQYGSDEHIGPKLPNIKRNDTIRNLAQPSVTSLANLNLKRDVNFENTRVVSDRPQYNEKLISSIQRLNSPKKPGNLNGPFPVSHLLDMNSKNFLGTLNNISLKKKQDETNTSIKLTNRITSPVKKNLQALFSNEQGCKEVNKDSFTKHFQINLNFLEFLDQYSSQYRYKQEFQMDFDNESLHFISEIATSQKPKLINILRKINQLLVDVKGTNPLDNLGTSPIKKRIDDYTFHELNTKQSDMSTKLKAKMNKNHNTRNTSAGKNNSRKISSLTYLKDIIKSDPQKISKTVDLRNFDLMTKTQYENASKSKLDEQKTNWNQVNSVEFYSPVDLDKSKTLKNLHTDSGYQLSSKYKNNSLNRENLNGWPYDDKTSPLPSSRKDNNEFSNMTEDSKKIHLERQNKLFGNKSRSTLNLIVSNSLRDINKSSCFLKEMVNNKFNDVGRMSVTKNKNLPFKKNIIKTAHTKSIQIINESKNSNML